MRDTYTGSFFDVLELQRCILAMTPYYIQDPVLCTTTPITHVHNKP